MAANGLRVGLDHKELGRVDLPGLPVSLSATPGAVRHLPDDDHRLPSGDLWNDDETGFGRPSARVAAEDPRAGCSWVLEGLRVVDASSFIGAGSGRPFWPITAPMWSRSRHPKADPDRIFACWASSP